MDWLACCEQLLVYMLGTARATSVLTKMLFSSPLLSSGRTFLILFIIFSSLYFVRKKDVYVQVISLSGLAELVIFGQPERVKFR